MHPACKAKDKTKGSYKLKSGDVAINYKLTTWRVVDRHKNFNLSGFSASRILEDLSNQYVDDYDHDLEDSIHDSYEYDNNNETCDQTDDKLIFDSGIDNNDDDTNNNNRSSYCENDDCDDDKDNCIGDDDDDISFCDVGIIIDQIEGDEDWCMVEEM